MKKKQNDVSGQAGGKERLTAADAAFAREAQINVQLSGVLKSLLAPKSIEEISGIVLECAKKLTTSKFGFVGYIDTATGYLVCPTLTKEVWAKCNVKDKNIIFKEFCGLWGWVLDNKKPLLTNNPSEHPELKCAPESHIRIDRFLSAPSVIGEKLVGQVSVANSERNYTQRDLEVIERLGEFYALAVERVRNEQKLQIALSESRQRAAEVSVLLDGARAVLEYREFEPVAKALFESCKKLTGATAGYVALLSSDREKIEVLFLDSGGQPCDVDPELPMPIRGLRQEAYRGKKVVYDNDFSNSEWAKYLPDKHVTLDNVLFVPLILDDNVVGLMGLANKAGGFTDNDARLAGAFGEIASIALHNNQVFESLEQSEERYRSVTESAVDAVITADSNGRIVTWNNGAKSMFGYSEDEITGKKLTILMPRRYRQKHQGAVNRLKSGAAARLIGQTIEMEGLRKDGGKFPLALSLSKWETSEGTFYTGIIRDITERRRAEEALARSEKQFRDIVEHSSVGVYRTTPDGRVIMANPALVRMLGYVSFEELAKRNLEKEGFEPEYPRSVFREEIEKEGKITGMESAWTKRDGSKLVMIENARLVRDEHGNILYYEGTVENITERKQAEEALQKTRDELEIRVMERTKQLQNTVGALQSEVTERIKAEEQIRADQRQLRHLAAELLLVEERERHEIAVELHDTIGQILAFSSIELGNIMKSSPATAKGLHHIRSQIEQAITAMRTLILDLSPPILYTFGLEAAIEQLAEQYSKEHGFKYNLACGENLRPMSNEIEVLLYRSVRELFVNIAKHAKANAVKLALNRVDNMIQVTVEDDGVGFDQDKMGDVSDELKGFGLFSIRERLSHFGGSFEIQSGLGCGTKVMLTAPLETEDENKNGD